jgi:tetratricopeptide (TPR) repeat protein
MTSRTIVMIGLLAAAFGLAPLASAQDSSQIATCQGGWEVEDKDKVAACTALLDGKQLKEDEAATVHYFRGAAFKALGAFDKSMADFNEAVRLAPDAATPLAARGGLLSDMEKFDEAIADFDKAIKFDPGDGYTFHQRGDAYESKGMHARAIADYDEAVRLDPNDDFVLSTRCRVRATWGQQLEEAVKDCSKAITMDSDNEYSYEQRGLAHLRLSQYAEAIADYGEALKKYSGRTESLYGRGLARIRSGDASGGQEDIAAATRIEADIAKTFAGWGVKPP